MKITLCGQEIQNDVDIHESKQTVELLHRVTELIDEHKIGFIKNNVEYCFNDFKIDVRGRCLRDKTSNEVKFDFYDTLCDNDIPWVYKNSENNFTKLKFSFDDSWKYDGRTFDDEDLFNLDGGPMHMPEDLQEIVNEMHLGW